ncbi:IS110 family transposase [Jeotgalibacillus sp. ET6]|uniref:IS110 family transposase n=1 Tax=Jeotgalibacillus sp. ET6 TaxID=3037260 RepID=UPI0024187426|nr:IS110 family transposase [Jeotgalibacillus sp. ET6]MDG5470509.1 IS110 family transposase [Jeotgalibacillus sp. ET6]
MQHVIAFDVSMGTSAMVMYDRFQQCVFEGELKHTQGGFGWLKKKIEEVTEHDGQFPEIVFEATGVYSNGLEEFLKAQGYPYCKLNPLEAKLQMASMRRHKTDISDAHELAKSHYRMNRPKTYVQEDYYAQMRSLGRYYEEIDKEITQNSNRLHGSLQLSFSLLEQSFSRSSDLFLNLVQFFPHPDCLDGLSEEELRRRVRQATRKNMSVQQVDEKVITLLKASKGSYPSITSGDVRCQHIKNYARRILELQVQKKEVIQQMVELSKDRVEYQVFLSFPGVGENTAVRIIGELGDISRFQKAKQINAYAGIDIHRSQSGKHEKPDTLNKRGNRRLRKILYFMVMSMISLRKKTQNTLVDHYDRLKKQPNGKVHKVAVIACMNKFIRVSFHLIQHGLLYQYEPAKVS